MAQTIVPMSRERALQILELFVERGMVFVKTMFPEEALRIQIASALAAVDTASLLANDRFKFSLRLVLLIDIQHAPDVGNGYAAFRKRISEIFPAEIANLLTEDTLARFKSEARTGSLRAPTAEEINRHLGERSRTIASDTFHRDWADRSSRPTAHGTITTLIPCPKCSVKKRCDAKTKRFRCSCGFDSTFPFPR